MKNYNIRYSLNKPTPQSIWVSKNSAYCISLALEKNGEKVDDFKLYDGNTELSSSGTFVGDPQYSLSADSTASKKVLKVTSGNQVLDLFINTTDSSVAELGQGQGGGSEYVLPIASASTLGGVKVNGNGVSIAADGTLSVSVSPSSEETDPIFNDWLSGTVDVKIGSGTFGYDDTNYIAIGNGAHSENSDSIAIGTDANADDLGPISPIAIGKEARASQGIAIGPGAVGLTGVAIGLSANASNLDEWAEGTVAVGESTIAIGENAVAVGKNAEARGSSSVALGYDSYVDGNGSVQLGQGVNENDDTLQFQDKVVIDEDGYIPAARLGGITTAVLSGTYDDDTTFSFEVYTK